MAGFFVGEQPIQRAFVGTTPVKSIWVGDMKVWPTVEEIMYTVTSAIPSGTLNTWYEVTNLKWMPDGPTASGVELDAGNWVMLVYAAGVQTGNYRQYGVRTSAGDTISQLATAAQLSGEVVASTVFTLASAATVTPICRRTAQNVGNLLNPGDVLAFAPLP